MTNPNHNDDVDLDAFKTWLHNHKEPRYPIDDHKYGAMRGHLKTVFRDDDNAKHFLFWAFGVDTTEQRRDLPQAYRAALWDWLNPTYDEATQTWLIREQCQRTASALIHSWLLEAGQQPLFGNVAGIPEFESEEE